MDQCLRTRVQMQAGIRHCYLLPLPVMLQGLRTILLPRIWTTKQYQQPLIQVQPTIQQQSSTTTRSDKISNQVITGPPAAKKEPQKEEDDNTRASKLTKNALAGMKRMKKRKPPKRPATPTKNKDNSSRLAAMKLKLKAELKKQTEVVVPKKKHQDFLGLGYKTKESKALEDTVTS